MLLSTQTLHQDLLNLLRIDVEKLTKDPKEEYEAYIDKVGAFSGGMVCKAVKLADLEDNMNLTRLKRPLNEKDIERVKKYHKAFLKLGNFK